MRQQARAEGLDVGLREGRAARARRMGGSPRARRRVPRGGHARLLAARVELAAEVERQLPRLLFALARKVIHQELSVSQTAAQTVMRGIAERLAGLRAARSS